MQEADLVAFSNHPPPGRAQGAGAQACIIHSTIMMFDCKAGLRVGQRVGSSRFQSHVVAVDKCPARQSRSRGFVSTSLAPRATAVPERVKPATGHWTHHFRVASSVADTHKRARHSLLGKGSCARFASLRRASRRLLPVQLGATLGGSSSSTSSGNRNRNSNRGSCPGSTIHTPEQRRFIRGGGQHFPHSDQVRQWPMCDRVQLFMCQNVPAGCWRRHLAAPGKHVVPRLQRDTYDTCS